MGIKGLTKLLADNAPSCMTEHDIKSFFGRKVAIDASMCIYQFLVAIRTGADNLTNAKGDITSHLSGLFHRTIRLAELGLRPVYVFDGTPPTLKSGELAKRRTARDAATAGAAAAKEAGDKAGEEKFARRINKMTPEMGAECRRLLKAMGVPVVEAPGEAEAQCARMCGDGVVYAVASEDMDALTFGASRLVRNLFSGASAAAEKKGVKPLEFVLEEALKGLGLDMDGFVDLCVMCGCDYAESIRGVGPSTALKLIKDHGDIEKALEFIRKEKKYTVPDEYPVEQIRKLFKEPDVIPSAELSLKWGEPDEDAIVKLLVEENQFQETAVRNAIKRLRASKGKSTQGRLDSFFKPVPKPGGAAAKPGKAAAKGKDAKKPKTVIKKKK